MRRVDYDLALGHSPPMEISETDGEGRTGRVAEVGLAFLRLGLTSFGGPVAHLGYFRDAFVVRLAWIGEADYADLVAFCQFLPGPASSQVGIAIGWQRAGYLGALAAWAGFTLPSVLLLLAFAFGLSHWPGVLPPGLLHGLKIAALAVVAQAVWSMARTLAPDVPRRAVALLAAMAVLLVPQGWAQLAALAVAGAWGGFAGRPAIQAVVEDAALPPVRHGLNVALMTLFFLLLVGLPLVAWATGDPFLRVADIFYRAGALVFGGGHLVLPLLQAQLVPGLISRETFLAGYGATQAVPGPLFSFAAFAGAMLGGQPSGLGGAALALGAIYLPSFLLVLGLLPYWHRLRRVARLRAALDGVNAAVVGLLLAALYDPVFTSAVATPADLAFALLALGALQLGRIPPWLLVVGCGLLGLLPVWAA